MRISQQIGWSQESKLIYQLIQQTEKLNTLLPGNQPGFHVPTSKQIGWSNEANLYYELLRSLSKLTAHFSDCCGPTTTTTTTQAAPREWCTWSGDATVEPYNYISEYRPLTNELTNLYLENDFTGGTPFLAASTEFKLWKYSPSDSKVKEWFINSYPASLLYSRETPVGSLGYQYTTPDAICAYYDNNHIMMTFYNAPFGGLFRTVLYNLTTYAFDVSILSTGITNSLASGSLKIASMMVTAGQKVITVEQIAGTYEWVVKQYPLVDDPALPYGWWEAQISLSSIPLNPSATNDKYYIFTYADEIYIGRTYDSSLFKIDLAYPYNITEVTADLGWSEQRQYWSSVQCNTVHFESTPTCATAFPPLGGSFTYYGRTVTNTAWSGGIISNSSSPVWITNCVNLMFQPERNINFFGAPFTYQLTFSSSINDITLGFGTLDWGDEFTITTDTGDPIITSTNACHVHIVGNQIITDSGTYGGIGNGYFTIHAPTPFTVLNIAGTNLGNGGPIWFACDTSLPPAPTTTTTTTLPPPSGIRTIYTTFDVY